MKSHSFVAFFFTLFFDQTKINALDQCHLNQLDCGPGQCAWKPNGNRCQCPRGLMGPNCQRPCQNVYNSCERWRREQRCALKSTSFFQDNCALSCQTCESNGTKLPHALPVALEPLAWLIGRWETQIRSRYRFPTLMQSPFNYTEIMDIQLAEPNMFDRPSLNYSVMAVSLGSPSDVHLQLGFLALNSPVQEHSLQQQQTSNRVAIAMTTNTGLNTIEEGVLEGKMIFLVTIHTVSIEGGHFLPVKRRLTLAEPNLLDEQLVFVNSKGEKRRFAKRFRRVHDYLKVVEIG